MKTKSQYESRRNTYCWLGFGLGIAGNVTQLFNPELAWVIVVTALILNVVGCYNWAMAKARSPVFCLWGLLAPIGFLGTALLQDKWSEKRSAEGVDASFVR